MGLFDDIVSGLGNLFGGGGSAGVGADTGLDLGGGSFDFSSLADFLGGAGSALGGAASTITPEMDFFNQANAAPQGENFGSNFMGGMSAGGAPNGAQAFNLNPAGPSSGGGDPTDWQKWGKYAAMMGIPVAASGMQTLMQPSAPKMPALPPPPAPSSQSIPPFTDQPGTKASPLITPGPPQARQTTGLQRRPAPYGGFSMY